MYLSRSGMGDSSANRGTPQIQTVSQNRPKTGEGCRYSTQEK